MGNDQFPADFALKFHCFDFVYREVLSIISLDAKLGCETIFVFVIHRSKIRTENHYPSMKTFSVDDLPFRAAFCKFYETKLSSNCSTGHQKNANLTTRCKILCLNFPVLVCQVLCCSLTRVISALTLSISNLTSPVYHFFGIDVFRITKVRAPTAQPPEFFYRPSLAFGSVWKLTD